MEARTLAWSSHFRVMKPKRLKVYARLGLISTKLPIVKDLIEIITHGPMYHVPEQYEDGSR